MQKPAKQMKNEPVSFNLANPDEKEMHDFAKQRNFSSYVKRLIWTDMIRRSLTEQKENSFRIQEKGDGQINNFSPDDFI